MSWTAITMVIVSFIVAGAVGAVITLRDTIQDPSERPPASPLYAATKSTTTQDAQPALVTFQYGQPTRLRSTFSGLVTAVPLRVGDEIASGDKVVAVDGVWRFAYRALEPPYRNLRIGDVGPDVAFLIAFLSEMGYDVQNSDEFGSDVRAALRAFQKDSGMSPSDGTFRRDRFVWLPGQVIAVGDASVVPGDTVQIGDTLFEGSDAPIAEASVKLVEPPGFANASYVLDLGSIGVLPLDSAPIDAEFQLSPSEIARASTFAAFGEDSVTGQLRLASPSVGISVLPSALTPLGDSRYCLLLLSNSETGYTPVLVTVIGSEGIESTIQGEAITAGLRYLANPLDLGIPCSR